MFAQWRQGKNQGAKYHETKYQHSELSIVV